MDMSGDRANTIHTTMIIIIVVCSVGGVVLVVAGSICCCCECYKALLLKPNDDDDGKRKDMVLQNKQERGRSILVRSKCNQSTHKENRVEPITETGNDELF